MLHHPMLNDSVRQAEIGLCVLLAAADGDVSEEEIGALSSRVGRLVGDEFPVIAIGMIVEGEITKMSQLGPERYITSLADRLPEPRRVPALRGAHVVAASDGLAPEEESMFHDVALELGIAKLDAERMLAEVRSGTPSA